MDDDSAAFVDSLLAPEMRAAAAVANPLGSLPFELPTPPTSSSGSRFAMTPRLAETLLGRQRGSHSGTDALPPASFGDDAGLEAARSSDYDDFVFRQLMGTSSSSGGPDFDDTGSLPPASTSSARSFQMALAALASTSSKDSAVEKPPTSTNSLLFEPLELPKGGITAPLDQSFKDAFGAPASLGADSSDSPVVSPPNSMSSLRSFSSVFNVEPCSTPRSPVYSDPSAMMPVLPLSSNGQVFFTSSGMNSSSSSSNNNSSSAGLSSTVNTSVASQPMSFWLSSTMTPTTLMRGVMDSFDSATVSPPGSMKQMLLSANSGLATPPLSEGYGLAPYMMVPPNAALQTPLQMLQSGMWTPSSKVPPMQAMMQTPSAIKIESNTARRGKKRSRSRLSVSASDQNPSSLPTMTPTNDASKQLVVSADVNASFMKSEASAGSSRAAKRACNSRVRSPSTVSPMATRTPMLSPTSSDAATVSGSGSDGDNAPSTKALKGKKCVEAGCTRRAQSNSRCKAHGGGARCQYAGPGGCSRSSQGGGFCRAHGGGKRCEYPGCVRGQQRKGRCFVHGGIRRCQWAGCEKKDRGNGFCISHGGGKRCQREGCARAVRRGNLCQLHDTHGPE